MVHTLTVTSLITATVHYCYSVMSEQCFQKMAKKGTNILAMFPQAQLQELKEVRFLLFTLGFSGQS